MPKPKSKPTTPHNEPDAQFKKDYARTRKRLEKLEMELTNLKKELFCLAHDPHIGVPHGGCAQPAPKAKKKK